MDKWVYYNPNPEHAHVGDCAIRAVSKALGQDWETVYAGVSAIGFQRHDMPNANHVWGRYLRKHGFTKHLIPADFYTVSEFCDDHPTGIYVLAVPGHVVTVKDGRYFDTWDSGNEIPMYYWREP